ncbi:MAG TPA: hypothetical protein VJL90_05520, partial [Pseudorhodoplanes sp.]|nr:hypothetical protein [Pseudorhodoplanes sp.]
MRDFLLPLLFITPLCVMAAIAFCIWHAYQLHKRIRGTAPFVPSPRFSNFMCTLLMPDWFPPKRTLLAGQSGQARAEIDRVLRKMRIGILIGVSLVVG